ncbi:glycosyltransferase family 4 protein [Rhodohalobacter sp. 614A]|uniref:glycosyltransferase family 4 protein n=1 Tax=Rhodohalobacter sp. 614A TaxID=2908649 RepID=UPI001F40590A|nr:glycosyltransferase family 4 protein [Rhodohalobacter sp. 614A]
MSEELKSITLTKKWGHHTKSGGYDKITDYLSGEKVVTGKSKIQRFSLSHKSWKYLVPSSRFVNHYEPVDFFSELKILRKTFRSDFDIIHVLYAEDQLNFLLKFRKYLDCSLIATFHMPASSKYVQKAISAGHYRNFKKLDAAIVVSHSMVDLIGEWIGEDNVHVIPHGIDTSIFHPDNSPKEDSGFINLLSVGHHGRDWETILDVMRILQTTADNYVYNVVVPKWMSHKFKGIKNVKIHNNIPEQNLIELYQKADVLLLPVLYGTANNSILEAFACGTPVVSSKVGGIPEYVDGESGWLFEKGDSQGIAELIKVMFEDSSLYLSKRDAARKRAQSFDWNLIADKIHEVYLNTHNKRNAIKKAGNSLSD